MDFFVGGALFYLDQNGPTLLISTPQNTFNVGDYFRMGNFFYLAIGQGNTRNYGLYELPVPTNKNYHAYIYAFDALDEQLVDIDHRCIGTNYCLLVLFFPLNLRNRLPHPVNMEKIIREELFPFYRIDQLKDSEVFSRIIARIYFDSEDHTLYYHQQPNIAIDEPFNASGQ